MRTHKLSVELFGVALISFTREVGGRREGLARDDRGRWVSRASRVNGKRAGVANPFSMTGGGL